MAFEIKVRSPHDAGIIWIELWNAIEASRFTATLKYGKVKRKDRKTVKAALTVHEVRLRKSKHYCGSHPAACENPTDGKKAIFGGKRLFLEGADWIAWNDLVNDVLDGLGVDADVASPVCEVRVGRNRRVRYDYHVEERSYSTFKGKETRSFPEWDRFGESGDYADFCNKPAPTTEYPEGTPGLAQWRVNADGSQPGQKVLRSTAATA